jgi:polar amino acid transport system substrate-binding protein
MTKRRPICFPLLIALSLFSNAALCQPVKPLTLYTEDLPPYNMAENDHVTGISSEIIATALNGLQIGFTVRLVAWQRAYHEALTDPNSCVYSTVKTPEREELFQWIGPIGRDALGVFVLPDSPIQARTLAELKGFRTVITPGDYAEAKLRENGIKIVPAPLEAGRQLNMMSAGRIDVWIANRNQGQIEAKQAGIPLRELFSYDEFELYLACNRALPSELIGRIDAAVKQVWDSGEAARITAKFTSAPRTPAATGD